MITLQVGAVYLPPLQAALHTTPLDWIDRLAVLIVALPVFVVAEGVKEWRRRHSNDRTG